MAYAKRVDANQKTIVTALRGLGMKVYVTSMVGHGFPDLCASYAGKTHLIEIKDGSKPPSAQKLTQDEREFIDGWLAPVHLIRSVDDAINLFQSLVAEK